MKSLLAVAVLCCGCGAIVEQTDRSGDASLDGSSLTAVDGALDAAPDSVDLLEAGMDPGASCAVERDPQYCWKCCSNVPELSAGFDAFYRSAFACVCAACSSTCALTCKSDYTTPDDPCIPCFHDNVAACEGKVPDATRAAFDAYVACTDRCR